MKYIASVSFGKDSLAMLLKILENKLPLDVVVFYNTRMEFDAIYNIRDKVKLILDKQSIDFVELHPSEDFEYCMFDKKIKYRNSNDYHYGYGWCGGKCRWGTTYKLRSIAKYKKQLNDYIVDYVGIAADEQHRFDTQKRQVGKRMPLVEWGMTEADCLQYCHDRGFYWIERSTATVSGYVDLYDILDRVSCWCCANKNLKELRNMYWYLPQYWERLSKLQEKIETPIRGKNKESVFDLESRFIFEKEWIQEGNKINTKEFYTELKNNGKVFKNKQKICNNCIQRSNTNEKKIFR